MVRFSPSSPEIMKKKGGIYHVQEPVKLTHLETTQKGTMGAVRSLHTESGTEKSEVKRGYSRSLIGVPDLLARRHRPGLVRGDVVETEFITLRFE